MKTYVAGTVIAVLIGLAGLAQAAKLLSPPLPTNVNTTGMCYIRNSGTTPVSVQVSLFSNNSPVVTFDNCNGAPLLAGHICQVEVDLPDSSYAACSVTAGTWLSCAERSKCAKSASIPSRGCSWQRT